MKKLFTILTAIILFVSCTQKTSNENENLLKVDTLQGISLLGKELIVNQLYPVSDSLRILNYLLAKKQSIDNPDDAESLIWFGRRMAYLGDYKRAIEIFTEGIEKFPDDARMYRHRRHRYISLRKFDDAIADLKLATNLIEGKPDEVEPDGIPNIRNTPVSSLQNNIWYHLGLAYYLKNDMDKALQAYNNCLEVATNQDMQVATRHWLYMILRRLEKNEEAKEIYEKILDTGTWAAFGYIAAEADMSRWDSARD